MLSAAFGSTGSVWEGRDALRDHVYRCEQLALLRARTQGFGLMTGAVTARWWLPVGHLPTTAAAGERITHLRTHRPTPRAFRCGRVFRVPTP